MTSETTNGESKQLQLDKRYLAMAHIWAQNSYCERRQVGALLIKDKMIIRDGYNGTPSGFENVCEDINNNNCTDSSTLGCDILVYLYYSRPGSSVGTS